MGADHTWHHTAATAAAPSESVALQQATEGHAAADGTFAANSASNIMSYSTEHDAPSGLQQSQQSSPAHARSLSSSGLSSLPSDDFEHQAEPLVSNGFGDNESMLPLTASLSFKVCSAEAPTTARDPYVPCHCIALTPNDA